MQQVSLPSVGTNFHTLKLGFVGNRILVSYDGTLYIDVVDSSSPYTVGGITVDMWTYQTTYQMTLDDALVSAWMTDDNYAVNEDTALILAAPGVLTNDAATMSAPTVTLISGPSFGTLNLSNNGGFTYTPSSNFIGNDVFTYQAISGATVFGTGVVNIVVSSVNDAPVATSFSVTTLEDTVTNLTLLGSDVDNVTLTYAILVNPTNGVLGTLNPTSGAVSYTPDNNYVGNDFFRFTVSDGALMATGSVSVTVSLLNGPAYFYVDNALTNSLNTGNSWANAWTNFSSVIWGNNGVKAGDTLYISGGRTSKTYTNSWSVGASGLPGYPLRIALNAADTNHNGRVIFDYNFGGDMTTVDGITCLRNYVTFDGNVGGECRFIVANLRNIYNRFSGVGLRATDTTGVVIDHLSFTNCNNPIQLIYTTNFVVKNCTLYQVRGDVGINAAGCRGSWDSNLIYSNYFELLFNGAAPAGVTGPYSGPDGIQCGDGISIFNNVFREVATTNLYTSDQHPDMIQATGNYMKVYGNEFINVGDSAFDYDCFSNPTPHDIWIYNNVFRITEAIDDYPEFIRVYASYNSIASFVNFKIWNNTFVDNDSWIPVRFFQYGDDPVATGNEFKNNIFHNCGGGEYFPVIVIEPSCGFTADSFEFDGNIYFHPGDEAHISYGGDFSASAWVREFEPNGKILSPTFAAYLPFNPSNDLHLASNDLVALNAGLDLSSYFLRDKDGVTRTQGLRWDIGAYEKSGGGNSATNLPPTVSTISHNALDADATMPGTQILPGTTVQYSGSASDANGDPLVWQWIQTFDGGVETVFQSGTGTVGAVSYVYDSNTVGREYEWKLRLNDGFALSESKHSLNVVVLPRTAEHLTFEAESGVLTGPFIVSNGYICQVIQTNLAGGGRATYDFIVTNAGNYVIRALVKAPSFGARCLYVNIDAEPVDSSSIWAVPIGLDFNSRFVSWLGTSNCLSPQFNPKIFNLAAGSHQIIVRGKDPNVELDQISLVLAKPPEVTTLGATGITDSLATMNGVVNPLGSESVVYFHYGLTTNYGLGTFVSNVEAGANSIAVSWKLSGLIPNTEYMYRAEAFNSQGTNSGSNQAFTTKLETTLAMPSIQGNQLLLSIPTAAGWNYILEYKLNLSDPVWITVTNTLGNGGVRTLTDADLVAPQKFYRVRVGL